MPCGTTGEASTLSNAEHHRVIEVCIEQAAGRVPVIAGCGSNDTRNALLHMQFSKKAGAAAGLCVAPYYNRPSQAGLIAHFSYLAENSDLPIVLYNAPGRTVTDIEDETVVELVRKHPDRTVAIKDASGDLSRARTTAWGSTTSSVSCRAMMSCGCRTLGRGRGGWKSITANVAPALCAEFHDAGRGDTSWSRRELERAFPGTTRCSPMPARHRRNTRSAETEHFISPSTVGKRSCWRWSMRAKPAARRWTKRWRMPV